MFKKTIAVLMGSVLVCSTFAQDAAAPAAAAPAYQHPDSNVAIAFEEDDFDSVFAANIEAISKVPGAHYSVAESPIGKAPADRDYVLARYAAFQRAYGNAITDLVEQIKQEISTEVTQGMLSNNQGLTKTDLEPKLGNMLNQEIGKILQAQGVNMADPAAVKAALPRVVNSESMQQKIASVSSLYVRGMVVKDVVHKGDKVGILVYTTPGMKKVSDALAIGGTFPKFAPQPAIREQLSQMTPEKVASAMGVRMFVDERGEPCIVSFAQAQVKGNAQIARREATMLANAAVREFAGTMVALAGNMDNSSDLATLEDQSGNFTSAAQVSQTMKSLSSRVASKMKFNGLGVIWSKRVRLPSGQTVLVVASAWSPTSADIAAAAEKDAQQAQQMRQNPRQQKPVAPKQNIQAEGSNDIGVIF